MNQIKADLLEGLRCLALFAVSSLIFILAIIIIKWILSASVAIIIISAIIVAPLIVWIIGRVNRGYWK